VFRPRSVRLRDGRVAVIRRAVARDARAVLAHANAVGRERIYTMTERLRLTERQEWAVFRAADGRAGIYLVATIDGTVCGTATFTRGRVPKMWHVVTLGIALGRTARGVGLGTAMMHAGTDWARSVGVRKMTLGVFATNTRALRLYRGLGYRVEGRLRHQAVVAGRPVDELLMALWLRPFPAAHAGRARPARRPR